MTEEEAKQALFEVHYEYMTHSPKERLKLYDEYQKKRNEIKKALANYLMEQSNKVKKI